MLLPNHKASTAASTHSAADPSVLSWRKNQRVVAGVVSSLADCLAGFERAEDPM